MKKSIFPLIFLALGLQLKAQPNLIPNPSFEQKTDPNGCIDEPILLSYEFASIVANWKADDADPLVSTGSWNTPDYFNSCADASSSAPVNVPQNFMGHQNAKDGDAYVGISYGYKLVNSNIPDHGSEYVFTQLISPLEPNETYTFSMYVSKAELLPAAANQLGAAFATTLPFAGGHITTPTLTLTPQVLSNSVISDETGWTLIEGLFTAQGGEQYIIIGHFPNPQTLQVEKNGINVDYTDIFNTYYYIDDVSLRKGNFLSNKIFKVNEIKVYPNPTNNYVIIDGISSEELKTITMFDVNGKKVSAVLNNNKIDISRLSSGIYMLKIETREGTVLNEKIVKK